jgi:pimeloyl-ACP methyl ester carboxylesterase
MGQVPEAFKGLQVPPAMRRMIGLTIAVPMATVMSRTVLEQVFRPEPVPDSFAIGGGGALGFRASAFEGAAADLADAQSDMDTVVEAYGDIGIPTAILFGRGDAILDYRIHGERTAAEIPDARLTVVEGGHMLPFTQPLETAQWIRESIGGTDHD